MRIFAVLLLLVLALLQFRLWISDDGVRELRRLQKGVAEQSQENSQLRERNRQLAAEVQDLKEGLEALEERARSDLGMVGANETFYQVVAPERVRPAGGHSLPAEPPTRQATKQ